MLVIAAAVAVTVWTTYLLAGWPPDPPAGASVTTSPDGAPTRSAPMSPSPSATAEDDGTTTMVVLGDSFTAGTDQNDGPEWPALLSSRLGWEIVVEAAPRSGYVGSDEGTDFGDRVDAVVEHPADIVLLAGGISDLNDDVDEVTVAAEEVAVEIIDRLPDAELVIASPFSNGRPGPVTTGLAERLEQVATDLGVTYLDVTEYLPFGSDLIGDDGVHPSDKGHRKIAQELEQDLTEADLAAAG